MISFEVVEDKKCELVENFSREIFNKIINKKKTL